MGTNVLTFILPGDSAKQARISQVQYRKYFYYLTGGDERVGEIIRETLDVLDTYLILDRKFTYFPPPSPFNSEDS